MAKRTILAGGVAEMIADWFGRSVIETDYELAYTIMDWLDEKRGEPAHRDPTYGWNTDDRA